MTTHTETQPEMVPQLMSATSVVHIQGDQAGSIRVNCDLPSQYSADDLRDHLRLELPGETSLLEPSDVEGGGGHFTVGFFSSDITNAGHLPADCKAVWVDSDGNHSTLLSIPVETAAAVTERAGQDAAEVPGSPGTAYPRTVGVLAVVALIAGGVAVASWILSAG